MARPIDAPEWASDTNYPAGTDAWSATATKLEPTAGEKGTGATPLTGFGAQQFNWLLNHFAEWIAHLDDAALGGGFYLKDDFCGTALDTGAWESATNGGSSAVAVFDDSATGGSGTIRLTAGQDNAHYALIRTAKLNVGAGDFLVSARVRASDLQGSFLQIGFIHDSDSTKNTYVEDSGGTPQLVDGSGIVGNGLTSSTSYSHIVMERIDGTIRVYQDGSLVDTVASATSIAQSRFVVRLVGRTANAGTAEAEIDMALLWFER